MVTLLGSLLGFLGALLPEGLKLLRDVQDRKHELAIMDRQMELQKLGLSQRLEEIRIQADTAEARALYQTWHTGVHWVDALNGSVRPVLAYAFFMLYALVKMAQGALLAQNGASVAQLLPMLWNVEDQAIFAGIISFYFGQRALRKRN